LARVPIVLRYFRRSTESGALISVSALISGTFNRLRN
jgi:hypothetical protein